MIRQVRVAVRIPGGSVRVDGVGERLLRELSPQVPRPGAARCVPDELGADPRQVDALERRLQARLRIAGGRRGNTVVSPGAPSRVPRGRRRSALGRPFSYDTFGAGAGVVGGGVAVDGPVLSQSAPPADAPAPPFITFF